MFSLKLVKRDWMKKYIILAVYLSVFLIFVTGMVQANEFSLNINYMGYYSDNIFMNANSVTDYVSQLHTDINFSVKKFNIYLDTTSGIFTENPNFNSINIEAGLEFFQPMKGRNGFSLALAYSLLKYKKLYTDFNFTGPRFQAEIKIYTSSKSFLKAGYSLEVRNYSNYGSFDFHNHKIFVEWNRFFETQTKIHFQTGINYRYYPHIIDEYDFGENYNYFENHGNSGHDPDHHGSGNKNGPGTEPVIELLSHNLGVPNIYGLFQIKQAIGTHIGLTGETELRVNFSGLKNAETLIRNSYIIYPNNDNYLWDGIRFGLKLKTVIFTNISFEGSISYFNKNYPDIFIMDEEGMAIEPMEERKDSLLYYGLKLSKKIGKIGLSAFVSYRDNASNDSFFRYNTVTTAVDISYYF